MHLTPVSSSLASRAGHRAAARRGDVDAATTPDLPDHAAAPVSAAAAIDPERRPLPPQRALVPTPPVVTRAADALLALRAYGAPARQTSSFPAGSLLRLAV